MSGSEAIGARLRTWERPEFEGVVVRHVNRNGAERPEAEALYVVLRADDGTERQVRRRRLTLVRSAADIVAAGRALAQRAPSPEPSCSPPQPEPTPPVARCAGPKVEAWRLNERAGAVYLEREPGGTWRCSLVLPGVDGEPGRQAASARGVASEDLEEQLASLARRAAREALRAAGGYS